MAAPAQPTSRVVNCCHCSGPLRVSTKAISVSCPHCNQRVALEDVVISATYTGRSLVTCGNVMVEANGKVTIPIQAQNVIVRGSVKAPISATNRLTIAPTGEVIGDMQAAVFDVQDGARVSGACRIRRIEFVPATPGDAGAEKSAESEPPRIKVISNRPMR